MDEKIVNPLEEYMKKWEKTSAIWKKRKYEKYPKIFDEYPFADELKKNFDELTIGEKMLVHYNVKHGDWPVDAHITPGTKAKDGLEFHEPNLLSVRLSYYKIRMDMYDIDREIEKATKIDTETLFRPMDY